MATQIQFRRDTSANWISNNPILGAGEVGLETDTNAYKMGDGVTSWTSLNYNQLAPQINSLTMNGQSGDATTPTANNLTVYAKAISGRMMLKQIGPSGEFTALQPFLARNKVGYWAPPGNATTLPEVFGYTAPTTVGTTTAANVATTNLFTRMRRLSFVSAATAGALSSYRVAQVQIQLGDGFGNGGFYKIMRFGCSDPASVSGARQFFGISNSNSVPTNVEPSTLTNSIGIGHGAADSNMMLYYGGSVAQTPINLGSNFPINTLSTDAYELALYSPSEQFAVIYYEITRINTGDVITGVLVGDGVSIILPSPYTLLTYSWNYRTNNTTAAAVSIDVISDYIETNN
jgi:hypothetical protein